MNNNASITADNKQTYEKLYGRELTNQEHFEIQQNLVGFIETLIRLNKKQKLVSIAEKQDRRRSASVFGDSTDTILYLAIAQIQYYIWP